MPDLEYSLTFMSRLSDGDDTVRFMNYKYVLKKNCTVSMGERVRRIRFVNPQRAGDRTLVTSNATGAR